MVILDDSQYEDFKYNRHRSGNKHSDPEATEIAPQVGMPRTERTSMRITTHAPLPSWYKCCPSMQYSTQLSARDAFWNPNMGHANAQFVGLVGLINWGGSVIYA